MGMGYCSLDLGNHDDPEWFPTADEATRTLSIWVHWYLPCVLLHLLYSLKERAQLEEERRTSEFKWHFR